MRSDKCLSGDKLLTGTNLKIHASGILLNISDNIMRNLPTDNTWRFYGKKEPYFAVFGQKDFLYKNLRDRNLNSFFSSGSEYVDELFSIIRDKIDSDFNTKKILDFGCGPGRMVIPFSHYADEVYGMDISEEMLYEAEKNCEKNNVKNANFLLADDQLKLISGHKFDLVHSFIVLQHLNTKRGKKLILLLLDKIAEEGIGVLHITYSDSLFSRRIVNFFRFKIPYLPIIQRIIGFIFFRRSLHFYPQMQMNSYNLNEIYAILQKNNIMELYSVLTNHHDYWGVTLYFKKTEKHMNF